MMAAAPDAPAFSLKGVTPLKTGWGPAAASPLVDGVPYAHFSRGERVCKIAEISATARGSKTSGKGKSHEENAGLAYMDRGAADDFTMVDTSKLPKGFVPHWKRNHADRAGQRTDEDPTKVVRKTREQQKSMNTISQNKRYRSLQRARTSSRRRWAPGPAWTRPSVHIDPEWEKIEELDMKRVGELRSDVPEGRDLAVCGTLREVSPAFKRVVTAREPQRRRPDVHHAFVRTADDAVMTDLMLAEGAGTAFATEAAITTLMAAKSSLRPWDLVVTVIGETLILDTKDANTQAYLELETVHENAFRPPPASDPTDVNQAHHMSVEAARATRAVREALVDGSHAEPTLPATGAAIGEHPHEPKDGQRPESAVFRYRAFDLGAETLVVRTAAHAVERRSGVAPRLLTVAALPERWADGARASEWRKTYPSKPGTVLLDEMRDNRHKMSRVCAGALLAGADEATFGFVTRRARDDWTSHVVLGTQSQSPASLLHQMNVPQEEMWGVVSWALGLVRHQVAEIQAAKREAGELAEGEEDGDDYKFLFMYHPETETRDKAGLRVYAVRPDEFEEEEEDEEEEAAGEAAAASASSATR